MDKKNDINAIALQRVSERLAAKNGSNKQEDNLQKAIEWYSKNLISRGIQEGAMPADRESDLVAATINSFKVICSGTNNNAKEHIKTSYNNYLQTLNAVSR